MGWWEVGAARRPLERRGAAASEKSGRFHHGASPGFGLRRGGGVLGGVGAGSVPAWTRGQGKRRPARGGLWLVVRGRAVPFVYSAAANVRRARRGWWTPAETSRCLVATGASARGVVSVSLLGETGRFWTSGVVACVAVSVFSTAPQSDELPPTSGQRFRSVVLVLVRVGCNLQWLFGRWFTTRVCTS